MANLKFTELTEDTSPTSDDLVATAHDPAGTPASKKVTLANLTKGLSAMVGDSGSGGTKGLVPAPGAGDAAAGKFLKADGTFAVPATGGSGGIGDVVGPGSSTDNALVRFDGTTGKLIQNSTVTLDDIGAITVPEMAAPATPAAGKVSVYAKSDGKLYIKDDAGTETDLTATGAGGGGGAGTVTVAHLGSDVTNSTSTAAKVTGLDTALSAGTYVFKYFIRYQVAATSTGVKFSVNYTGSITSFTAVLRYTTPATTSVSDTQDQDVSIVNGSLYQAWARRAVSTAANMGPTANTAAANQDHLMILEGLLVVSGSGNIELYHASEVNADSTVKIGTSLILTRIA